jgi:hypothetical protein
MSDTIKSITNCPTCGVECKIGNGGGNSHYYIPQTEKHTFQSIINMLDGMGYNYKIWHPQIISSAEKVLK